MASNNMQFGLLSRPNGTASQRRAPRHTQPQEATKSNEAKEDNAYIQSRKEKRANVETNQHTYLPRPSIRQPSPVPRSKSETGSKGRIASPLGFASCVDRDASSPHLVPTVKEKVSRNVLRRKPSSIAQHAELSLSTTARTATSSPASWGQLSIPKLNTQAPIEPAPPRIETSQQARKVSDTSIKDVPRIIPELDRYRTKPEQHREELNAKFGSNIPYKLITPDISPPTPSMSSGLASSGSSHKRYSVYSGSGYSASPSTRFSGSPGPSAYSRDTTPTSMSSVSPSIFVPFKSSITNRRGSSPTRNRPPLSRRRESNASNELDNATVNPRALPSLRESVNSSSSNSTVKADGKARDKSKKKSPLPPSPPPRKSSHQFRKSPMQELSPRRVNQSLPPAEPILSPESSPQILPAPSSICDRPSPPRRPSRDGAPDLRSQIGDFAVLQSNFTGMKYTHNKIDSFSSQTAAPSPLQTSMTPASRESSRNPSPAPLHPLHRTPTPAPNGLGLIPNLRPPSRGRVTRTPSPSVDSGKYRFGLFGRRTKTAPEITTVPTDKPQKKGPAAGTGHEGYTRYALRGRSTTKPTTGKPRERSFSGGPISRDQLDTTDPFFRDRMSPVIIAGGGAIKENRNSSSEVSRTESNTSLPALVKNISQTSSSRKTPKASLQPSAIPKESSKRISTIVAPKIKRPSESQDEDYPKKTSLALRRSIQRLNTSTSALSNFPKPLNITTKGHSSPMSSLDPSLMSGESQLELRDDAERGRPAQPLKPKKLEKRARSPRKWNFFHRQAPKAELEIKPDTVPVTIGRNPVKPIPHYAMFEFSDEPEDTDSVDLAEILRDSDVVELTDEQLNELQFSNYKENIRRIEELQTAMAPSLPETMPATVVFSPPERMMPPSPQVPQSQIESHVQREVTPVRPSRLQQVGRIPKVISARPEATSPISFSRPFARLSTIQHTIDLSSFDFNSVALGASPPKLESPETHPAPFSSSISYQREFLAFSPRSSPRNNSTATTSSSGTINRADITAIIPEPDSALAEDEVWDEYDDLIEIDGAPRARVVSTTSSYGVPFQYETYQSPSARNLPPNLQASPFPNRELPDIPRRRSAITSISSSCYSGEVNAEANTEDQDTLKPIPSPNTPVSYSEFFNGYGEPDNSIHSSKYQGVSAVESRKSDSSSNTSRISGASLMRIESEESNCPISQVNLRVGSMSVSKWLTFGNVLFSPARDEVGNLMDGPSTKCHSILVIDGLGNDDWSFYAAETYPTCTFYNLSPTDPPPCTSTQNPSYPLPPFNHRQITFSPTTSLNKFPFPSSTFSTVIFRFPSSLTTQTYNHILSESRRVLKPGGYIEITLLDLDMLNMGPRTRRSVRGLKTRLKCRDEGVVLGSLGDMVLRELGTRGFGDVKSCCVGIPVAGVLERANSAGEKDKRNGKGKEGEKEEKASKKKHKDSRSLAEMIKDESESADESITRMVARVGRWWYMRCYESSLITSASASASLSASKNKNKTGKGGKGKEAKSIFADMKVLGECEKWNTSFKLVVIHAQKPVVVRRRTNSV